MICAKTQSGKLHVACRFRHDLKTTSGKMSSLSLERSWRKVCSLPLSSGILSESSVFVRGEWQRLPCCCTVATKLP